MIAFYKILEMQEANQWLPEDEEGRGEIRMMYEEIFRVMDLFILLIVMMISQAYACVKTY